MFAQSALVCAEMGHVRCPSRRPARAGGADSCGLFTLHTRCARLPALEALRSRAGAHEP